MEQQNSNLNGDRHKREADHLLFLGQQVGIAAIFHEYTFL
jgi:hypothetical protein